MSQKLGRGFFSIIAEGHTPALANGLIDLSDQYIVESSELTKAVFVAPAVGTAGFITTTIAGTYAVGDLVRLTIASNLTGRQKWRKSYTHTVQAGATTVTDIAVAFVNQIQADISNGNSESPYASVSNAAGVITITQDGDDKKGFEVTDFTDSAAGTIVSVITPTVISEGQPSDLTDRGVSEDDINLASYDTVRITLQADTAIPFINSAGSTSYEIYWYGTPGEGANLATLINP